MTMIGTAISSILILGILIFVHEFGHFLVAKLCRVGVVEFAIGFGRKLYSKKIGETVYSLRLIPLGGFVRMVGDDPFEVFATSNDDDDSQDKQEVSPSFASESALVGDSSTDVDEKLLKDRSRWFLEQGLLAKAAIVIAGPMANYIFAIVLAIFSFYVYGAVEPINKPIIGGVLPDYPAQKAGIAVDDEIIAVNSVAVTTWDDMAKRIGNAQGEELVLELKEKGTLRIKGQLDSPEMALINGSSETPPTKRFKIGITPKTTRSPISFQKSVYYGFLQSWQIVTTTFRGIAMMVSGSLSTKNIGGPIIILREAARSADSGLERVIDFMVFLSVSLAILNLLPIPILDGGHLFFFVIEGIIRKPVNLKIQAIANQVGMAILLLLMVFAMGNDLRRVFGL